MTDNELVLQTVGLTKCFDDRPAVDRVDLKIVRGRSLGIAGESGGYHRQQGAG